MGMGGAAAIRDTGHESGRAVVMDSRVRNREQTGGPGTAAKRSRAPAAEDGRAAGARYRAAGDSTYPVSCGYGGRGGQQRDVRRL